MSEDMKKRVEDVSAKVDALNARVDMGFARVEAGFARVDAGFARVDVELSDHRVIHRRIISTLVRLEGKVDDLAERMATKDDIAAVNGRIDGLAGRLDDFHFRWANHEERITALEKRRS